MPERTNRFNILTGGLLPLYITLLGVLYFLMYKTCTPFSSMLFDTSDMDSFCYLFGGSVQVGSISIKNLIYSCCLFFSGDVFMSYTFASFILFAGCVFFIYKIVLLGKGNRFHALFAVFVFSTFPNMFLNIFAVNVHITETLFVLMLIYFYFKSILTGGKIYSVAYLLIALMSLSVRSSMLMYLAIIILLTSCYQLQQKKYLYPALNFIVVMAMVLMIMSYPSSGYFYSKLGHWNLYFENLDFASVFKVIRLVFWHLFTSLKGGLSWLYLILFVLCFGKRICISSKNQTLLLRFLEFAVLLVLLMFAVTVAPVDSSLFDGMIYGDTPLFDDIFPVYALFAILLAEYVAVCIVLRNRIKIILLILVVCAGVFQAYATFADFRKYEKAVITNTADSYSQGSWVKIYDDISATVSSVETDDFLFVVDKEDINDQYSIKEENNRIVFVPLDITTYGVNNKMNYIFDYIYDIMLLHGYNNFSVASGKARTILKDYSFEGHTLCFISKYDGFEFESFQGIEQVNIWKLELEGKAYGLYLYAVMKEER